MSTLGQKSSGYTLRTASKEAARGVHTFYMVSPDLKNYTVQSIRTTGPKGSSIRRWQCTCGDVVHRQSLQDGRCKHIRAVQAWVKKVGGISRVQAGVLVKEEGQ